MCSVIGFAGEYDKETLDDVFKYSRIRGLHAFGYAYCKDDDIIVKRFFKYEHFIKSIHKAKPSKFIAHFRYSTSGDHNVIENNQPLKNGDEALVFNGVVSQMTLDEMKEAYTCHFGSDNDGWILLDIFDSLEAIKSSKLTYASIMLRNKQIIALRNKKRPIWFGNRNGNTILASTSDILKRSNVDEVTELKSNVYYKW